MGVTQMLEWLVIHLHDARRYSCSEFFNALSSLIFLCIVFPVSYIDDISFLEILVDTELLEFIHSAVNRK
jgi:hypothetical protein